MKISPILFRSSNAKPPKPPKSDESSSGADSAMPVYAKINKSNGAQLTTVRQALDELSKVTFDNNDLLYVRTLGAKPPFQSGQEAIKWIGDNNVEILYADFSNPKVHACLNYDKNIGGVDKFMILINSNYKNNCSKSDTLAISEAIFHECGHGKDCDSENSIQEELDCMSLNVLAHRFYKKNYVHVFNNQNSFLYSEGVSLYPKLFYEFNPQKPALKNRMSSKYGYLQTGDAKHPATKIVNDIKSIYKGDPLTS